MWSNGQHGLLRAEQAMGIFSLKGETTDRLSGCFKSACQMKRLEKNDSGRHIYRRGDPGDRTIRLASNDQGFMSIIFILRCAALSATRSWVLKFILPVLPFLFLCLFFPPAKTHPFSDHEQGSLELRTAIIVSRHIKPYMDVLKGLRQSMSQALITDLQIYMLEQHDLDNPARVQGELSRHDYDMLVSIGPEATNLAWSVSADTGVPTVFSMVLNPDALAGDKFRPGCGISLGIPISNQLREIKSALPQVNRLGILFDPEINRDFVDQAMEKGSPAGFEIVPLEISSSRQIPDMLSASWERIDGLWFIPDQTVISQALVEFVIKEALFQNKPVIGYNRFFYDSGASVAFALVFEEIGRQTALLTAKVLEDLCCEQVVPAYEVLVNHRVIQRLGLSSVEKAP